MIPKEVFISHSSGNIAEATAIAETIREHGVPVWFSGTNIMVGNNWLDEIGKALERCDWFMILLSNDAINSIWVKRELYYALIHNQYNDRILPVVIEPCDYEKLSWVLGSFQMVDFHLNQENAYTQILRSWGLGFDRNRIR
jgi:hypothetical protein